MERHLSLSQKASLCSSSPIRKFHPYIVAAEQRGMHIHYLNIGQPDIPTPEAYFHAIQNHPAQVLAYAPSQGIPPLISAVQNYYSNLGAKFDDGDILITTGGSEALQIALSCILNEDDEILVPEPFYPNYRTFTLIAGGSIRPIPTRPEDGYFFASRDRLLPHIGPRTRALLLTNPGNPTGTLLTTEELRLMADIAKEHNLYLICDEVYREFVYQGEVTTAALFRDIDENLILVDSVSKRFSACGARIGALISRNKELMEAALKIAQARLSVATLDQVGATALYGVEKDYFTQTREEYRRRRDVCYGKLSEIPGVITTEPSGAFYMMAKLPVEDTEDFQRFLLTEMDDLGETLVFAPGEGFYATAGAGKSEIRLAYVLCCNALERAIELLKIGLERYLSKNGSL